MKKFYFMAFSFALGAGSAYAQSPASVTRTLPSPRHATGFETPVRHDAAPVQGVQRDAFWSEDFSGGFPAGWTTVDEMTTNLALQVEFEWTNDPSAVAVASAGHTHIATFNAETASNGYLWADSDRGLPSAPGTDHLTKLTTSSINCSGQESVLLSFQSTIGVFDNNANEFALVRVSTDGSNWTDYVPFPCLTTGAPAPPCNRFSANPQHIEIDISATAANQTDVYIQWYWQGGWEYYWALDDVMLSPVPPFSRQLVSTNISHVGQGLQYGRIPSDQFFTEFILGGSVRNNGLAPQNNLALNMVATGPGGAEFSATEMLSEPLMPGDTAVFMQIADLPAVMPEGLYTIMFSVTSDEDDQEADPNDDMATRVFEVNNDVYSLDGIGVHPPTLLSTTALGTNSFTGGEDALMLLTFFEINATTTVYGLEALLASGTVANSVVITSIHSTENIDADNVSMPFSESDLITVTEGHITNGRVHGIFLDPVQLEPGGYYAAIELLSNAGANHVRILDDITEPQPPGASLINLPGQGIFTNGNAHALRLLLDPTVSINERDQLSASIYPNPTNGLVNIFMGEAGAYDVEVLNLLGERVHTTRIVNNAVLDLSGNAQGVYMVRISNEKASTVQRITLN